jgi:hypothetical protein
MSPRILAVRESGHQLQGHDQDGQDRTVPEKYLPVSVFKQKPILQAMIEEDRARRDSKSTNLLVMMVDACSEANELATELAHADAKVWLLHTK